MARKSAAKTALAGLGWRVLRFAGRDPDVPRISVIMYHSIGSRARMSLDPAVFDRQMAEVGRLFPEILTVGELATVTRPVDKWTACLTFDDGYADNHEIVLSVLRRYGFRATFFICSGFITGEHAITRTFANYCGLRPMSWSQIRELSDAGMEIGAHTHSHTMLTTLTPTAQFAEMEQSKKVIEDNISLPVASFAIPFGNRGTYTTSTLDSAAKLFKGCCTTRFSTNHASPVRHGNMLVLDRVEAKPGESLQTFTSQVQGRWDAMKWIQRKRRV